MIYPFSHCHSQPLQDKQDVCTCAHPTCDHNVCIQQRDELSLLNRSDAGFSHCSSSTTVKLLCCDTWYCTHCPPDINWPTIVSKFTLYVSNAVSFLPPGWNTASIVGRSGGGAQRAEEPVLQSVSAHWHIGYVYIAMSGVITGSGGILLTVLFLPATDGSYSALVIFWVWFECCGLHLIAWLNLWLW